MSPADALPLAGEIDVPLPGSGPRLRKLLSLLVCAALAIQFLPPYVAPRLAVERSQVASEVYRHLNTWGRDPWGNSWRWEISRSHRGRHVQYSAGANGRDEGGGGDDLVLRELDEFAVPWVAFLFLLWSLPFALCACAWLLILRAARRAEERSLGWRELGWAALTGGPLALFAAAYAWWGSDHRTWRDLSAGQGGGLLGWRLSLTGSVVAALFVAGWALSRPPRRREGWSDSAQAEAEAAAEAEG